MFSNSPFVPKDTAEVDRRLRSIFLKYGIGLAFILLVTLVTLIPMQWKLSRIFPGAFGYRVAGPGATSTPESLYPGTSADCAHVFSSLPSITIDIVSAALIITLFWIGISRIKNMLIDSARSFAERRQWADVSNVLESFNQSGQHLLDSTGEAHYLLAIALQRVGKPQAAQTARDYLLKRKGHTIWAQKLLEDGQPNPASRTVRPKRRRF